MHPTTSGPSLSERVAGAIFWNTVTFPLKVAIKFLASLVIAWVLSREQYGLFQAAVGSLVATIWTTTGLGISASILKFVPEVMQRQGTVGVSRFLRQLFGLRLGLLFLVVGLLNLESGIVITRFHLGPLGLFLLRAGSVIVVMRAVTDTCSRVLTAYFKQKTTNTLDIISALVQPLLILLLVPGGLGFGLGIRGAVFALLIGSLIDLALALYALRHALRQLPTVTGEWQLVPHMWRRFTTSSLINYVMDQSVLITSPDFVALLLLWFARPGDLADIEVGWNQVIILLGYLVLPLNGIYVPMFSEIFVRHEEHKLPGAYATLTRTLLLATVPPGIGWIMLAPQVFTVLRLASKYPHAAATAQVLTFFLFAESIVVVPHVILMVYERYRVVMASRLLTVLGIPLIWLAVRGSSPVVVALTIGALRCGSRLVLTPYASRAFKLQFPWRFGLRLLVPSAAFALVLTGLSSVLQVSAKQLPWINVLYLAVLVLTGLIVFMVGFKALGGLDPADRKRLAAMRIPLGRLMLRYL
ncbi:MAG: oligosaccharide flippase family protein [Herpetosiphonaceae bacterium]|nr:oligosaccharide flippase family protein [Herpetosiphonaceae bacterium]